MDKGILTVKRLKAMDPGEKFATGTIIDNPMGINIANTGEMLRWVAVRGGIHDWAIYVGKEALPVDSVASYGDKIRNEASIKKLVEADEEALEMYRY